MSPGSAPGRRPKDRRQSIQSTAVEYFATQGFAATGLADIAASVGVTPSALYRHFAGKDAVLEAIIIDSIASMGEVVEEAVAIPADGAPERLARVLAALFDFAQAHPAEVTIYIRERHRLGSAGRTHRRKLEQQVADAIASVVLDLRPDLPAQQLATRLRAMYGALASIATQRHEVDAERLRALFVEGLAAVLPAPPADEDPAELPRVRGWLPPRTRRAEIMAAATHQFRLNGYHGATIDQIGEAAGIAGPTIYLTYPAKVDILVDAVDYAVTMLQVLTDQALTHAGSAEDAITLLAESYAETILTNLDIMAVAARDIGSLPEADRMRIRRRQDDYRQVAQQVLIQLRPNLNEAEARTLFTTAYALVGEIALGSPRPSIHSAATLMETFLLPGEN